MHDKIRGSDRSMAIRGLGHSTVNLNRIPKHELRQTARGGGGENSGSMSHSHSKYLEDSAG